MEFGSKDFAPKFQRREPLEPITAIGNPPARHAERDGGEHSPPEREHEVSEESRDAPGDPEDLLLHGTILGPNLSACEKQIPRFAQDDNPDTAPGDKDRSRLMRGFGALVLL